MRFTLQLERIQEVAAGFSWREDPGSRGNTTCVGTTWIRFAYRRSVPRPLREMTNSGKRDAGQVADREIVPTIGDESLISWHSRNSRETSLKYQTQTHRFRK